MTSDLTGRDGTASAAGPPAGAIPPPEPGADSLRLRSGTQPSFLESMRRSAAREPGLAGFRVRADSDPAVALLDAWACVLDVLTFYSERAAQEGYLRTATESRSVAALARAVGYERGPGGASTTVLAFTLEDVPGAPALVPLPAGTQVASRPGPGETPQTFETGTDLDARPEWNAMGARTSEPHPVQPGDTTLHLAGVAPDLRPGGWLLLATAAAADTTGWALRAVTAAHPRPEHGVTRITWSEPLPAGLPVGDLEVHALRLESGLFGATAPDWRAIPADTRKVFTGTSGVLAGTRPTDLGPNDWPRFGVVPAESPDNTIDLDGAHPEIVPGSRLVLRSTVTSTMGLYRVEKAVVGSRSDFAISSRTTRVTLTGNPDIGTTFTGLRTTTALAHDERLRLAERPIDDPVQGSVIDLAAPVPAPPAGRTLVVTGRRPALRVADGATGLAAVGSTGATIPLHPGDELEVTGPAAVAGGAQVWPVIVAGQAATVLAGTDQLHPVPPRAGAPVIAETAIAAAPTGETTATLVLQAPLTGCYDRAGLTVCANVVVASHGETKTQVLGSGDSAQTFQRFQLAQGPLTWVNGQCSLEIRIDGVRWSRVGSLFGHGPRERVYTVRTADDGTATVEFGDGRTGARLPTGAENVRAAYRVGTGPAGILPAGRVELVMTRPLGLRAATNPLPTGLAADPDDPAQLRRLAPLTVRTLDRAVSVTDYVDLSTGTAGIAKAAAGVAVVGEEHVVRVAVLGDRDQPVGPEDREGLRRHLLDAGPAHRAVVVEPAATAAFDVDVHLYPDPAVDGIVDTVRTVVLSEFGFDARALDQPISRSEIAAAVQAVPGIRGATVTRLARTGTPGSHDVLLARTAPAHGPTLLTVNPKAINITVEAS